MDLPMLVTETLDDYAAAVARLLRDPASAPLPLFRPAGSLLPPLPFPETAAPAPAEAGRRWSDGGAQDPMRWYLESLGLEIHAQPDPGLRPSERLVLVAEALGQTPRAGAVAGAGSPQWALPAMAHAALTGRPFLWLESPEALVEVAASGIESLTICVPLHELKLPVLHALQEARAFRISVPRLAAVSFCAQPISFLTARTLEVLSRVIVKHQVYRQAPLESTCWLFLISESPRRTDAEVTLLTRAEANATRLKDISADLLMAYGHSREDIFYVGTDLLCGASHEPGAAVDGATLPACHHDGRCIKGGERMPVRDLPFKALFLNGCSTLRLGGGSFIPEYTLGLSFLEGSGNLFVASSRTRYGTHREQLLLYHLLRTGVSIGEAVRTINNTLPFGGAEVPDYLVLGEGDWRPLEARPNHASVELAAEEGGWSIQWREVDAQYVEARLPELPAEPYIHQIESSSRDELFFAIAPEPDGGARLLLFGWSRLRADRISVRLRFAPPAAERVEALRTAHRNLVYSRLYRAYSPKIKNLENELQSLSTFIARQLNESRHTPAAAARVEEKAAQAEDLVSRMNRLVCDHLLDKVAASPFVLTDQYMETDGSFEIAEHLPADDTCPYCTNPVLRRVIRHQISPAVRREVDICVVCGNVWDVPQGGIRPVYRNNPILSRRSPHPFEIVLRNTTGRRVRGWLGFRVYQAAPYGVTVHPPAVEVTLASGEERVIPFTVEIGETMPAHQEFLKGFWLSDLDISYFQRTIWVVP